MDGKKKKKLSSSTYLRVCDNRLSNNWVQVVFLPNRGEEKERITLETIRGLEPKCLPQMFPG